MVKDDLPTTHKAGFVNIIGKPNVGKSTLMNAFMGEKFSIITSKAQTTRHRILGILNGDDFQVVLSDTPGIIKPHYGLQKSMMKFVHLALEDADVLVYLRDIKMGLTIDEDIVNKLKSVDVPVFVVLNKIDVADEASLKEQIDYWQAQDFVAQVFPISALNNLGVEGLFEAILKALPLSPPFYPKDQLTDRPERFFVEEIIREKILLNYKQEIPYSVEVVTESFKEDEDIIRISALLFVSRKSQKPILIGRNGSMLKKVGSEARKDLEVFFGKKIFLQTFVKVKENWRDNDRLLKHFGYE
ncbi:MAG: GTPase Era [Saprospiraceae bacterium]|nr:GTPase Era [Saprospiraceae bacterium]